MASEIWSATLSGCPSVTDSEVNRWASRWLIYAPLAVDQSFSTPQCRRRLVARLDEGKAGSRPSGRRGYHIPLSHRPALEDPVEEGRDRMQGGDGDRLPPGLQAPGERRDHPAAPAGAGDGQG